MSGRPPKGKCPRWHSNQMPRSLQLTLSNTVEQWVCSQLPPNDQYPYLGPAVSMTLFSLPYVRVGTRIVWYIKSIALCLGSLFITIVWYTACITADAAPNHLSISHAMFPSLKQDPEIRKPFFCWGQKLHPTQRLKSREPWPDPHACWRSRTDEANRNPVVLPGCAWVKMKASKTRKRIKSEYCITLNTKSSFPRKYFWYALQHSRNTTMKQHFFSASISTMPQTSSCGKGKSPGSVCILYWDNTSDPLPKKVLLLESLLTS